MKDFVNLHAHCNLGSMLDGLHSAEQLLEKVKEVGQKAVALTDHGTMAAHLDAYKASKKTGVQLIPGCEMYYVQSYDMVEVDGKMKKPKRQHVVLLAQNKVGYRNLLNINFIGFQNQHQSMGRVFSVIDWNNLSSRTEGLIATSACANGPLSKMLMGDNYDEAKEIAIRFNSIFPNRFFLEIHPHHLKAEGVDQHKINLELIKLSREIGLPLVTAVDAHYLTRGDEKYHDMLMALNSKKTVNDPERFRYGVDDFYVKTGDEVFAFLSEHYGQEIATECLANTVRISEMCEIPTYLEVAGNHLPKFPVQDEPDYIEFLEWKTERKINLPEDTAYMRFKCVKGFKEKFAHMSEEDRKLRWERVKTELKVLEGNNFSSYMLVVADFIHWSKNNNILVGPGRGSVGGCMIAYLLGIHQVDPIAYGLLFERFQNAEKKDLPDIDIDFTSAGRDAVQEYVRQKYGANRCAQVSNINTYTPKNAIPDLVKSMREILPKTLLNNPNEYFQLSNKIKDAIDDEASSIDEALEMSEDLRNIARAAPELMDYAKRIVGLPKEYSTHAAAMVISDEPILNFAPLRVDKNGAVAVQYEKNRCEAVGLIKMDFLAISTLDIIDETFKNISRIGIENAPKRMEDIPLEDAATYETIQKGQTRCVFQLGKSGTMAGLCKQVKPKSILDIAAINALGRPSCGPIEQEDGTTYSERQEYIMRREGRRNISYLHSSLEVLKETFGLCIFEEQLMGVARDVAGWNLNKADGLRKLTKLKGKNPQLALQLEVDFIKDAMEKHNMSYEVAKGIWDRVVEKFSGYGFNLSHAVFYSLIGYYTAYLKVHYPAPFLAAYLKIRTERGGISKDTEIEMAKTECRRLGIRIMPPDVNRSGTGYDVLDDKSVVMGLSAIKGLGDSAVNEIVNNQPFESFIDFIYKTDGRFVNKSKMEALAKAACFDSLNVPRKFVHDEGKGIRDKFNIFMRKKQKDGYDDSSIVEEFPISYSNFKDWTQPEQLRFEQEVTGQLVSGTIHDLYPGFFLEYGVTPLSRIRRMPARADVIVEVIIKSHIRNFQIKKDGRLKNKWMAKYQVEDVHGTQMEMTIWPDLFKEAIEQFQNDVPLRALCRVSEFEGSKSLMLAKIEKCLKIS